METKSVFFPESLVERARHNIAGHEWAASLRDAVLERAAPWLRYTDEALWEMGFGPNITRSWMVWSNGHCPECLRQVGMYHWKIEPHGRPWKVHCPHCDASFPKNDFQAFHRSGLNAEGIFEPTRADRSLLVNQEDPHGPKRHFGVDDGEGYVDGDSRWRFIGAYLIYGQWKHLILNGVDALSAAWVLTGDTEYSRRAAIILDRVADIYPSYCFRTQGLVYEHRVPEPDHNFSFDGYVSNWHDCPKEVIILAEAYDRIRPALEDERLIRFLSDKAKGHGQSNPKDSASAIAQNFEKHVLRESLTNRHKIDGNIPSQDHAILVIESILGWKKNRPHIDRLFDQLTDKVTQVDGVTGEKGVAGYASIGPRLMAKILGKFNRIESGFLAGIVKRNPLLRAHFRFHIDTWCLHRFYPGVGDGGGFNQDPTGYAGVDFESGPGLEPSAFTVLGQLHQATEDPAFAQIAYGGNGNKVDGLPHDLFVEDPAGFEAVIQKVIEEKGTHPAVGSINLRDWHLAILRSGRGRHARALCLSYDTLRNHHHADTMNLSLFARGMDLLPDFGYPQVQYGGWDSLKARWYKRSAAHNTVVVDGRDSRQGAGHTTLWVEGASFRAMRMSAPEAIGGEQFDRTAALIDISDEDAYVLDIFRVIGGGDHARFFHSYAGALTTDGLDLEAAEDYGHETLMRHFRRDRNPAVGWSADWALSPPGVDPAGVSDEHLRIVDLTTGASAWTAEAWVTSGFQDVETIELWIPRLMTRRQGPAPLHSTFVGLIEPYAGHSRIKAARRLNLQNDGAVACGDSQVAVEIELLDGSCDLLITLDAHTNPGTVRLPEWNLTLNGDLCWLRRDASGHLAKVTLAGESVQVGDFKLEADTGFVEYSR